MIELKEKTYHFLEGGGEMGELTRSRDWSRSSVGPIEQWPQSLRTIVDVILHSRAPMLLWWGEDLIQFYNDAYRADLGYEGKHPKALGQKGEECWPEAWHTLKPLIDEVLAGGAIWREDQLIPVFRNGKVDDGYWTFSYSPVRDESGKITGVLVVLNETTRQVRSMEKMEQSERAMRSIVLHAPVGICILDADTLNAEVVNDIFLELSGKGRKQFEGKSLWQIFPELKDRYSSFLSLVVSTGVPYKGKEERLSLLRDGVQDTRYLDIAIESLRSWKDQSTWKIMILAIDVTDKVLARQAIEESEYRYRTLITESSVAIALYIGPELRIQYVNEIMTAYWGKDLSVVGKPLEDAVPEIKDQRFLKQFAHVYETGQTYVGIEEEAILLVGGKLQPFYFNYVYKPLVNADGMIYGIHHMAMDVTEQVRARKKVEQSEANLRNMILKAPVAMSILRGPGFIVDIANDLMFRLWGKQPEDMLQKPIFQALPEVRFQGFEEILERALTKGESFSAEAIPIALPRTGGIETVFVNFLYEPYRDADGTISGVMAVATDVTEQVKARQRVEELVEERTKELADSNRNLKRSNDELAQFAYIASHDLQEPARKISTFVDMLQKILKDVDPRSKTLLHKIEMASRRMLRLIRDVLAYSQLSEKRPLVTRVDLNQVLTTACEDFELLIQEKNATIEVKQLPIIEGIPIQMGQLFGNLIANALKFTHAERMPHILISSSLADPSEASRLRELDPDKAYYKISFRDNGIGFNQNNAEQIFDIFQRLHSQPEFPGTGIGLAMCR
ncbi:MAG: PAS domain-containing protein, partial [Bacteroidota bacterium]|nr:PAS domain-containing protein [Bacteroidota bacterium]